MTTPDEPSIAEQAARWVGALERGGDREHAAFAAWLKASPRHVREFLLLTALEREVDGMDLEEFDVDEVLGRSAGNVMALRDEPHLSPGLSAPMGRRGSMRWGVGLAAALVVGVLAWWLMAGPGSWESYSTTVGEQRTFELEDGSVVELNPHSDMQVRIADRMRDIRLLAGEAVFKVQHDPSRPFQVHADATVIRAVGTAFAVNRRTDSVTVSVLEGRVQVSKEKRILSAGDEVKIVAGTPSVHRRTADSGQTGAWRRRSLTFSGDTLAEIAEDFNRYNRAPKIRIEGDALIARQFSGVFDADDPQSLVDYLSATGEVSIEHSTDTVVIRSAGR